MGDNYLTTVDAFNVNYTDSDGNDRAATNNGQYKTLTFSSHNSIESKKRVKNDAGSNTTKELVHRSVESVLDDQISSFQTTDATLTEYLCALENNARLLKKKNCDLFTDQKRLKSIKTQYERASGELEVKFKYAKRTASSCSEATMSGNSGSDEQLAAIKTKLHENEVHAVALKEKCDKLDECLKNLPSSRQHLLFALDNEEEDKEKESLMMMTLNEKCFDSLLTEEQCKALEIFRLSVKSYSVLVEYLNKQELCRQKLRNLTNLTLDELLSSPPRSRKSCISRSPIKQWTDSAYYHHPSVKRECVLQDSDATSKIDRPASRSTSSDAVGDAKIEFATVADGLDAIINELNLKSMDDRVLGKTLDDDDDESEEDENFRNYEGLEGYVDAVDSENSGLTSSPHCTDEKNADEDIDENVDKDIDEDVTAYCATD